MPGIKLLAIYILALETYLNLNGSYIYGFVFLYKQTLSSYRRTTQRQQMEFIYQTFQTCSFPKLTHPVFRQTKTLNPHLSIRTPHHPRARQCPPATRRVPRRLSIRPHHHSSTTSHPAPAVPSATWPRSNWLPCYSSSPSSSYSKAVYPTSSSQVTMPTTPGSLTCIENHQV